MQNEKYFCANRCKVFSRKGAKIKNQKQFTLRLCARYLKVLFLLPFDKISTMTNFKHAFSYWCFSKLTDAQFQQIRDIGITGIEMPPADEYAKWRDNGFTIVSIVGHKSIEDGLNKKENHSRILDEVRANLEAAKTYNIPNLICFSGNREGRSDAEGAANTIEGLLPIAKEAEAAGVTLIMELLNSKDHKDYQCDHTAWGVEVAKAVNSPRFKLLYDIYHMQRMEGDLIPIIRENIDYIAHFHTAGNPGRNELNASQEIYYPAVARAIAETGYREWIGHEFIPKGDPVEGLREAFEACNV
jgi:hydroxypyruvate isomerase